MPHGVTHMTFFFFFGFGQGPHRSSDNAGILTTQPPGNAISPMILRREPEKWLPFQVWWLLGERAKAQAEASSLTKPNGHGTQGRLVALKTRRTVVRTGKVSRWSLCFRRWSGVCEREAFGSPYILTAQLYRKSVEKNCCPRWGLRGLEKAVSEMGFQHIDVWMEALVISLCPGLCVSGDSWEVRARLGLAWLPESSVLRSPSRERTVLFQVEAVEGQRSPLTPPHLLGVPCCCITHASLFLEGPPTLQIGSAFYNAFGPS